MAKGDQEDLMTDINKQKTQVGKQNQNYLTGLQGRLGAVSSTDKNGIVTPGKGLFGQQETQLKTVTPQFQNFASTGGINDETTRDLGSGDASLGAKFGSQINDAGNSFANIQANTKAPNYGESDSGYRQLASTGGIDPTRAQATFGALQSGQGGADKDIINRLKDTNGMFGGVDQSINDLRNFSSTGGMSTEDMSRINRPLFDEFEKTGGYSDEDKANIKKESNATVSGTYNNLTDALARQKATSGGYGPNFGSAAQKMARDSAIASGDQDLSTNININNAVRQGRMSAAQQIAANQLGVSSITTPAKLAAMQSAGTLGLGKSGKQIDALGQAGDLSRSLGQLQLAAANGDLNAQKMIQEGKIAGLGGLSDSATKTGQFELTKAGQASDNTRSILGAQGDNARMTSGNVSNLADMTQRGKQYGTTGLAGLYNSTNNQISDTDRNYLAGLGLDEESMNKLLGLQQQGAGMQGKNSQMFGNIMKGVGTAAMFL